MHCQLTIRKWTHGNVFRGNFVTTKLTGWGSCSSYVYRVHMSISWQCRCLNKVSCAYGRVGDSWQEAPLAGAGLKILFNLTALKFTQPPDFYWKAFERRKFYQSTNLTFKKRKFYLVSTIWQGQALWICRCCLETFYRNLHELVFHKLSPTTFSSNWLNAFWPDDGSD